MTPASAPIRTRPTPGRRTPGVVALLAASLAGLTACSAAPTPPSPSTAAPSSPGTPSDATGGTTTSSSPATTTTTASPSSAPTTPPADPAAACAAAVVDRLSASQRAGQLLMVGLDVGASRTSLDDLVTGRHLGGVVLLGGWHDGAAGVRATTRHLEGLAGPVSTGGLGLLVAADQEGGQVQQLRGPGFTRVPSARAQDVWSPSQLAARATPWARELRAAGVNVNLAPVGDTVPAGSESSNAPIGALERNFSSDPVDNARMVSGFIRGMRAGGVAATVKHFPGLGRVTGNTDVTSRGITDGTTSATSAYLQPFARAVADGVELVMVGSAIYPRIDGARNAVFSPAVVDGLLRGRLGYRGVVITDDVGRARAVANVPVGERAVRFVAAGGDVVLTASPSTVPAMHDALVRAATRDPAFAAKVRASVQRVVALKVRMGLASC